MVITDHRGTHGLRDTLSVIGRFSFQRVGSSCGVYAVLWEEGKAEPFYFWGVGFVPGASPSPRGYRPGVRQQEALDVGFL